jgi:hypothetical protein
MLLKTGLSVTKCIRLQEKAIFSPKVLSKIAKLSDHNIGPRDRCYDFLNIFAKKISKNNGVFDSKQS